MPPNLYALITLLLFSTLFTGQAQTTLPASPKKFVTRKNGSSTGAGSSVGLIPATKKPKTTTITITYTVLTKEREWENIDGKIMKARLLAFPPLDPSAAAMEEKAALFSGLKGITPLPLARLPWPVFAGASALIPDGLSRHP